MQRQGVTDVVQAQAMGQLGVEQRQYMAPRFEGAGVIRHASLPGQLRHQVFWNEIANLTQKRELTLRWLSAFRFVFHIRALWHGISRKPTPFFCQMSISLWDGCDLEAVRCGGGFRLFAAVFAATGFGRD